MTPQELAYLIGVHRTTLGNWESDKNLPSRRYIDHLSEHLGLDFNTLLQRFKNMVDGLDDVSGLQSPE